MSYLAFHSRAGTVHLTGREVRHIGALATEALTAEFSLPEHQPLRADLALPAVHSGSFGLQVLWLMSDGEPHQVQGHNLYLCDLALNVLYRHQAAAGILCWLYDKALIHGWVAAADRRAMAEQLQVALNAGVARAKMADQDAEQPRGLRPAGSRGGWEEVIARPRHPRRPPRRPGGGRYGLHLGQWPGPDEVQVRSRGPGPGTDLDRGLRADP